MQKLKEEIQDLYQNYKIFEIKLNKESDSAKDKESLLNKMEEEQLKNAYKDLMLKAGQLNFNLQQLVILIETYIKLEDNNLPAEIKEFYKEVRSSYNTTPLFVLDNEEIVSTDEDYLNSARKELDNNQIIKMLSASN